MAHLAAVVGGWGMEGVLGGGFVEPYPQSRTEIIALGVENG